MEAYTRTRVITGNRVVTDNGNHGKREKKYQAIIEAAPRQERWQQKPGWAEIHIFYAFLYEFMYIWG